MTQEIKDKIAYWIENIPKDTHEEYLKNLEKYKDIIDRTPDNFLIYHLENSIANEQYELCAYIKNIANKRRIKI